MAVIAANTPTTVSVPAGFRLQFGSPTSGVCAVTLPGKVLNEVLTDGEGLGPYQSDASILITLTAQGTCYTIRREGTAAVLQAVHLPQVPFLPGASVFIGENVAGPFVPAGWGPAGYQSVIPSSGVFTLNMPTYEAALVAANAAVAAGGGTVFFPAGNFDFGGRSLPMFSGVRYKGVRPVLQFANITDDGLVAFKPGTGTIISNTPAAFAANTIDLGAKLSDAAFANACINNAGVEGFGFDSTCVYGVRIGARYNGGPIYCAFKSLIAIGCTGWGFWFENHIQSDFDDINAFACGVGHQMYRVSEGGCGNSRWGKLLGSAANSGGRTRGICFTSEAGQDFGLLNAQYIQMNRFNNTPEWTATATGVNGSPNWNIGTGPAANFPIDLPVTVSASVNGFTAGVIYFVVSNVGGVIQLSDRVKGNAINSVGTSPMTIKSTGYACLECVVEGPLAAGGSMGKGTIGGIDLETGGSAMCVLQNWGGVADFTVVVGTASYVGVAMRGCGPAVISSSVPLVLDLDAASVTYLHFVGSLKSWAQYYPQGIVRNANGGANSSSVSLFDGATTPTLEGRYKNGLQVKARKSLVWSDPVAVNNGYALGFTDAVNSYRWDNGGAAGSFTLPTITDDHVGYPLFLMNPTGSAATVNAAAGQLFNNKAGVSSVTLAAKQSAWLVADKFAGAYYWAVQSGTITV